MSVLYSLSIYFVLGRQSTSCPLNSSCFFCFIIINPFFSRLLLPITELTLKLMMSLPQRIRDVRVLWDFWPSNLSFSILFLLLSCFSKRRCFAVFFSLSPFVFFQFVLFSFSFFFHTFFEKFYDNNMVNGFATNAKARIMCFGPGLEWARAKNDQKII